MERRRHERVQLQAEASVTCGSVTISGAVEDISLKGLYIRTPHRLPLKHKAQITLFFEGSSGNLSFTIPATVIRNGETGIGFSFEKIDIGSVMLECSGGDKNRMREILNFMTSSGGP